MSYFSYFIYFALMTICIFNPISVDIYGKLNKKLKLKKCKMEKKNILGWKSTFFYEAGLHESKNLWILDKENAVYKILYELQLFTHIVLIIHFIGCVIGCILYFNVSDSILFIYAVIEGSVFAAMLLADIVVSIVTLRKAFKSCPKE